MNRRIAYLAAVVTIALISIGNVHAAWGHQRRTQTVRFPILRTLLALHAGGMPIDVRDKNLDPNLKWVEIDIYDEQYPLTLNIVAKRHTRVNRIIYLVTSSSLNFRSSFFTPPDKSLAAYYADQDYLVIGITPREDNVPLDADHTVMADWGLEKHRVDVRNVVDPIQDGLHLPYDMLGHSFGAIVALDYAAVHSGSQFKSVMLLDLPSFGPTDVVNVYPGVNVSAYALGALSLGAYQQILGAGDYADRSIADLKDLVALALLYPTADSGAPRPPPVSGNFTLNGLLHYSLIFTAFLPGAISNYAYLAPEVPVPQEWPMEIGNAAGFYEFAENPANDSFGLVQTDIGRIQDVALAVGSGLTPIALARDYTAAITNDEAYAPTYKIEWSDVNEAVRWVNGGWGMGSYTHAATDIQNAGNDDVEVTIVPLYGHIDVILGTNAAEDVWEYLKP